MSSLEEDLVEVPVGTGCDNCGKPRATTGAIINGKFGQYCRECRTILQRRTLGLNAAQSREQDRSANARDLIQPWDARGNPNKAFIDNWPDEAKGMFTQEELEHYG